MCLVYLSPYLPDFNPIEEAFSAIKAWIRAHRDYAWAELSGEDTADPYTMIWEAVFVTVTLEKVAGWYHNCGYWQILVVSTNNYSIKVWSGGRQISTDLEHFPAPHEWYPEQAQLHQWDQCWGPSASLHISPDEQQTCETSWAPHRASQCCWVRNHQRDPLLHQHRKLHVQ